MTHVPHMHCIYLSADLNMVIQYCPRNPNASELEQFGIQTKNSSKFCPRIRTPSTLFVYVCAYVSPALGHPYALSFSSLSEAVVKASRVISAANFVPVLCYFFI